MTLKEARRRRRLIRLNKQRAHDPVWIEKNRQARLHRYATDSEYRERMAIHSRRNGLLGGRPHGLTRKYLLGLIARARKLLRDTAKARQVEKATNECKAS